MILQNEHLKSSGNVLLSLQSKDFDKYVAIEILNKAFFMP